MGVDFATATTEQHELELDVASAKATSRPRRAASKRGYVDLTLDEEDQAEKADEPPKKRGRKTTTVTKTDALVSSTKVKASTSKSKSKSKQSIQTGEDADQKEASVKAAKRARKKSSAAVPGEEKRAKRFREKAPKSWQELYERATTQRMFVLDRTQTATADIPTPQVEAGFDPVAVPPEQAPSATVTMAGTTGNVYSVHITHVPTCTCPAYQKSQSPCKHVIYVLYQVLKAPANLVYQLAFVTSELIEIFQHAPPVPTAESGAVMDGNRKPIEDDCPICCCELEAGNEEIVYCRAACGNNLHKTCFDQWAASKRSSGSTVTCPFCRTPWQSDVSELAKYATATAGSATGPQVNADGYINIAQELGISGKRDYSSYHQFWVRRQRRAGLIDDEEGDYDYDYDGY